MVVVAFFFSNPYGFLCFYRFLLFLGFGLVDMPPRKRDQALRQAYQQLLKDPEQGFNLDSYENQTTPHLISSLRDLPTIGPDITISSVGNQLPSNLPPNKNIFSINVLRYFLPIPNPDFIYRVLGELNISLGQLNPNYL